jgi:hypothetical protein
MKEYLVLLIISLALAIIIAKVLGLDLSNASNVADWIITGVLLVLALPFLILRIKDRLAKKRK